MSEKKKRKKPCEKRKRTPYVVSVGLSPALYNMLMELVERGVFLTLADAIREAVRLLLLRYTGGIAFIPSSAPLPEHTDDEKEAARHEAAVFLSDLRESEAKVIMLEAIYKCALAKAVAARKEYPCQVELKISDLVKQIRYFYNVQIASAADWGVFYTILRWLLGVKNKYRHRHFTVLAFVPGVSVKVRLE